MMTVYKYLVHQNIGGIDEKSAWCVSRPFVEVEGMEAVLRLDTSKRASAPHRMEIWLKRV